MSGKVKILAVVPIDHGYWDEDSNDGSGGNVVKHFDVLDELTDEHFTKEELEQFVLNEIAVDTSGNLQPKSSGPADSVTAARDELLKSVGKPVLVSTANPIAQGQTPEPQIAPTEANTQLEDENAALRAEIEALKANPPANEPANPTNQPPQPGKAIGSTKKS